MFLSYLDLTTTDPAFNLAAEQYVFDALPRDRAWFMLWQNDNAIIVGKHQNTFAEINEPYVRAHGIRVVRRLSGGGAVYHDLGNLNYTFITDDSGKLDFRAFCEPVVETLAELGVKAEISGRNDMTIDDRKFSGNAQYRREGRVMHHGTILFDSDLSVVGDALRVDEAKLQSKGVASVRSRVTNVRPCLPRDCSLAEFRAALLGHILARTPGKEYTFTDLDLTAIQEIKARRYDLYEWNYGASPVCTVCKRRRFEGVGTVEAYLTVEKGVIRDLQFRGDFFSTEDPAVLAGRFVGLRPVAEDCAAALQGVDVGRYCNGLSREHLMALLEG